MIESKIEGLFNFIYFESIVGSFKYHLCYHMSMAEINIKHIHQDILKLQRDISVIKHVLSEEGELTDWAKKALKKARSEPESDYVDLDDIGLRS